MNNTDTCSYHTTLAIQRVAYRIIKEYQQMNQLNVIPQNPSIITLPANLKGNDFVVGDLHGCYDELQALLSFVQFDPQYDRVIATGDLIHRGLHSEKCLELLDEKWFYSVLGNHDDIESQKYFKEEDEVLNYFDYRKQIEQLPYVYRVLHPQYKAYYVLHAELDYSLLFQRDYRTPERLISLLMDDHSHGLHELFDKDFYVPPVSIESLLWGRDLLCTFMQNYAPDEQISAEMVRQNRLIGNAIKIFCGHSYVSRPIHIGQQIYCDTGACFGYFEYQEQIHPTGLSLIDVNSGVAYICQTDVEHRGQIITAEQPLYDDGFALLGS